MRAPADFPRVTPFSSSISCLPSLSGSSPAMCLVPPPQDLGTGGSLCLHRFPFHLLAPLAHSSSTSIPKEIPEHTLPPSVQSKSSPTSVSGKPCRHQGILGV